jgi:hypothetical protein
MDADLQDPPELLGNDICPPGRAGGDLYRRGSLLGGVWVSVRDHRGRRLGLSNPGKVRLLVRKQTGNRIDQHLIGGPRMQTTRLFARQDALYPSVALGTGGPQRAFAPLDPKAQGALGSIR